MPYFHMMILRDSGRGKSAESGATARSTPEEILDERYAGGELTREPYLQMKEDLKKPSN